MKIGPDGSLCRITSSAKGLPNNLRIIKVPDSQPTYRLVVIKPNDEHEESSEKSDEEISDNELFNIEFPKNITKEKTVDTKNMKPNETVNERVMKERSHNRRYNRYKRNNRSFGHRNNFHKISQNCKNLSSMEGIYNYGNRDFNSSTNHDFSSSANRDFNSAPNRDFTSASNRNFPNVSNRDFTSAGNRDFTSTSSRDFNSSLNHHALYINADNYQHSSEDFSCSPWLEPPALLPGYSHPSYSLVSLPEKPRTSFGLLGDRPLYATQFQPNKQNDDYILDQNSTYTPMASNFAANHSNSFVHNQNLPYSQMPSNYSSNKKTDNFKRDHQNYWKGNYDKNKRKQARRRPRRRQNPY